MKVIQLSIDCTLQVAAEESPIDMTHLLHQSTCNVTCFICFGKLFDYDDQIFTDNIKRMERNFRLLFIVQVLAVFKPWISPLLYFGERIILNNAKTFKVMIKTVINEHVKVLESDKQEEMPSDFIYNFLSVAKEEKKELGENSLYTSKLIDDCHSQHTRTRPWWRGPNSVLSRSMLV